APQNRRRTAGSQVVGRCTRGYFLLGTSAPRVGVRPSASHAFIRYTVPASPAAAPPVPRTQKPLAVESNTSATSSAPRASRKLTRRAGRIARAESTCGCEAKPVALTLRYFSSNRATAPESGAPAPAPAPPPARVQRFPARLSE